MVGAALYVPVSTFPYSAWHQWQSPGTYTVSAAGEAGCSGQASTVLTITSPPAPDVLAEPAPDASGPNVADDAFPLSVQTRVERLLVRDRRDTVACVVEWADDDPVATVAIRVPATPPATLLQKLRRADRIIRDARCACSWCRRRGAVASSTRPCR